MAGSIAEKPSLSLEDISLPATPVTCLYLEYQAQPPAAQGVLLGESPGLRHH